MAYIDLHTHSNCSDGVLSPEELVGAAARAGLDTISLTDHDSIAGVARAIAAAEKYGIKVLPGVELSVAWQDWHDVHLLGYGIDIDNAPLLQALDNFAAQRANRNLEIIASVNRKLTAKGLEQLLPEEVTALADGVLGRPHIARALMARGYVSNMEEAFEHYLVPCNVPKAYWPMADAISAIHQAGGAAVLAHPTSITRDTDLLEKIIKDLSKIGLDGVEIYNSMASEAEASFLQGIANSLKLITTAGSDFHGIDEQDCIGKGRSGIRFSDALLPPLYEKIKLQKQ
ncbi:MAG: PHP domain-containing protein [Trichlorobacter sp.]|nr:PHP domain-containing protein [Trichlorobacter sp.]